MREPALDPPTVHDTLTPDQGRQLDEALARPQFPLKGKGGVVKLVSLPELMLHELERKYPEASRDDLRAAVADAIESLREQSRNGSHRMCRLIGEPHWLGVLRSDLVGAAEGMLLRRIDPLLPDQRPKFNEALWDEKFLASKPTGQLKRITLKRKLLMFCRRRFPDLRSDWQDAANKAISALLERSFSGELRFCELIGRGDDDDWLRPMEAYARKYVFGYLCDCHKNYRRNPRSEDLDGPTDERAKPPLEAMTQQETSTEVRAEMLAWPVEKRKRVDAHCDGRTDDEIAEEYGMSRDAVKQERWRIFDKLRKKLRKSTRE